MFLSGAGSNRPIRNLIWLFGFFNPRKMSWQTDALRGKAIATGTHPEVQCGPVSIAALLGGDILSGSVCVQGHWP